MSEAARTPCVHETDPSAFGLIVSGTCMRCGRSEPPERIAELERACNAEAMRRLNVADGRRDIGVIFSCAEAYHGYTNPREVPEDIPDSPRWWSPIAEVNKATRGGIYGITALGGDAGTGKSFFAIATAVRAVLRDDLRVVYLANEMAEGQILKRMRWIAETWGHTREQLSAELKSNLTLLFRRGRIDWGLTAEEIASCFYEKPTGLLIIDSINSLLSALEPGQGYWSVYEKVMETLLTTRKETEGRFGALVLSELNQRGGSKGEKLEYASDLMLNFKATTTANVATVRIVKNRERGESGIVGKFQISPEATYARVHA